MRGLFTLALLGFIFPSVAFGATFAKEALFLSKSPVSEGESVLIHAVVSNDSNTKFSGKLLLSEGETAIGSVAVVLEAQGAQVTSVSWKPGAGKHTLVAKLTETDGSVVEENSATFTVVSKEDTAKENSGDVDSSEGIQNGLAGISPGAANVTAPVFSTIDTLRLKASDALDSATQWAKKSGSKGSVLGASTEDSSEQGGIVSTIWSFLMTILIFIFS
ncbi:hypothetical protein H7X87_01430, partial [Acetobacteraceae bacterium]|nr:hypothetical protein [Candidatus Parcubacteria bacterium]